MRDKTKSQSTNVRFHLGRMHRFQPIPDFAVAVERERVVYTFRKQLSSDSAVRIGDAR